MYLSGISVSRSAESFDGNGVATLVDHSSVVVFWIVKSIGDADVKSRCLGKDSTFLYPSVSGLCGSVSGCVSVPEIGNVETGFDSIN